MDDKDECALNEWVKPNGVASRRSSNIDECADNIVIKWWLTSKKASNATFKGETSSKFDWEFVLRYNFWWRSDSRWSVGFASWRKAGSLCGARLWPIRLQVILIVLTKWSADSKSSERPQELLHCSGVRQLQHGTSQVMRAGYRQWRTLMARGVL